MARGWRSIKDEYRRTYPHQVRLQNAGGWRTRHTSWALRALEPEAWRWWTEGSDVLGTAVSVWGFKSEQDAAAFKAWSEISGIGWSVPPDAQIRRPSPPPDRETPLYGPTPPNRGPAR